MKQAWKLAKLGEVVQFRGGGTPDTSNRSYWNGEIPWVSPKDMKTSEIASSADKITQKALENSAASLIPAGAILIVVRSGILSRTVPVGIAARELTVNQDIKALCPTGRVDKKFLYWFLLHSERELLKRVTRGATVHRLPTESLRGFDIPLPPVSEQQRIVAVLDEAFEGLAVAATNAERNLKSARQLFGTYLDSTFESAHREWGKTKLGAIAFFRNGVNYTQNSGGDLVKIVGVKDFADNYWIPNDGLDYVRINGALEEADVLREGDILAVRSNGSKSLVGRTILVGPVAERMTHSGFTIRIRLQTTDILPEYLCYVMKSQAMRSRLIASGAGANINNVNQQRLAELSVAYPSVAAQRPIVESFHELAKDVRLLEENYDRKARAIDELRQSMLHKAFAGELA